MGRILLFSFISLRGNSLTWFRALSGFLYDARLPGTDSAEVKNVPQKPFICLAVPVRLRVKESCDLL